MKTSVDEKNFVKQHFYCQTPFFRIFLFSSYVMYPVVVNRGHKTFVEYTNNVALAH